MSDKNENPGADINRLGRAFNACISADWAITEEGYRNVLMIAARLNAAQAVEAYREEGLKHTWAAKVRDGVAIIPITGPIFRYANLFTYFSGGTSVSMLAKDFNQALNNPDVYSIMFEINSPGGEVTGINELGDMIYAARKKKPMTARVGGQMCSAALWLGVQAGDVAIDETAQVGSLGVYTAYLDDRKRMEMNGLEEIEFVSSQSPYKNAPPYTDEGKKRIQARLNAICEIFGAKVARGRGVPIKTVWEKFGQGDVFVGQAAIDAGLADRLGSYEETLRLLAKAHTPGYKEHAPEPTEPDDEDFSEPFDDEDDCVAKPGKDEKCSPETEDSEQETDEEADKKKKEKMSDSDETTIKDSDAVTSLSDEAGEENTADSNDTGKENSEEKVMSEENKTTNTDQPAETAAASQSADNSSARLADLEARERAIVAREAELKAREDAAAKAQADAARAARRTEFAKTAENFAGDKEAKIGLMEDLADKFGQDSAQFKAYVEDQLALGEQAKTAALFAETGKTGSDESSAAAEDKLDKLAKERAASAKISYEQAYRLVCQENQKLFAQVMNPGGEA